MLYCFNYKTLIKLNLTNYSVINEKYIDNECVGYFFKKGHYTEFKLL